MSHLATPETFMIDVPQHESECIVCGEVSNQRTGWLDTHCSSCNRYIPHDCLNVVVRMRREYLELDRDEMARIADVKRSTIAKYENYWPSKRYWELTRELIRK